MSVTCRWQEVIFQQLMPIKSNTFPVSCKSVSAFDKNHEFTDVSTGDVLGGDTRNPPAETGTRLHTCKGNLTSSLAFDWNMVWALWQICAKAALSAVIFCRPSYVISHWSGSISPNSKSKSTNALSNSFSKISSHRNDSVEAAIFTCIYAPSLNGFRMNIFDGRCKRCRFNPRIYKNVFVKYFDAVRLISATELLICIIFYLL